MEGIELSHKRWESKNNGAGDEMMEVGVEDRMEYVTVYKTVMGVKKALTKIP